MQFQERKRKRRCQVECKDHTFFLQSTKTNSSKYDIKLQFCPKFQRDPLPPEHTFPQFNNDRKYFTSAFQLGVDKRILVKNQQQQLMDHQKQIRDSLEKHNQLVFPRPNSKHSLCSVCKEHYKNYYFHIGSEEHREKIGLSSYNNHIKEICMLYYQLWDGCEEKADEEAERMAAQEEERRQRMAQAGSQEQYSESLADCQRGSAEQRYDSNGELILMAKTKSFKRTSSRNDDMPVAGRKRSHTDGRSLYEPAMRKHIYSSQTSVHTARERKERNYERQRVKLMKGTQFEKYKKDYISLPANEGDAFTVMKPVQPSQVTSELPAKKAAYEKMKRLAEENLKKTFSQIVVIEEEKPHQENPDEPDQEEINAEAQQPESPSSSSSREQVEQVKNAEGKNKKIDSVQQGELSGSSSGNSDDFFTEKKTKRYPEPRDYRYPRSSEMKNEGNEHRSMHAYNYPYHMAMHPSYMPHQPPEGYKAEGDRFKGAPVQHANERYKGLPEGYKGAPPQYYYPPYGYPPMYDPQYAIPPEKGYEGLKHGDKEKGKNFDKPPYDYSMHYPWPYPPYYMPPVPPHSQQNSEARVDAHPTRSGSTPPGKNQSTNPNNPYVGSTNININFPMYMCPPQGYGMPSSRYPMHHSMMGHYPGYNYPPYSNQERGKNGQGQYEPRGGAGQREGPSGTAQQHHLPPPPSAVLNPQPPSAVPQDYRALTSNQGHQSGNQGQQGRLNPNHQYYYHHQQYMHYHQGYPPQPPPKSPNKKDP